MERVASRARAMVVAAVAVTVLMPLLPSSGASHGEGCTTSCGSISIPYPFGVEPGCYLHGFNLTCNNSYGPPKLFLGDGTVQVLDISIPNATMRTKSRSVNFELGLHKGANGTRRARGLGFSADDDGPYFLAADRQNNLVARPGSLAVLRENDSLDSWSAPALLSAWTESSAKSALASTAAWQPSSMAAPPTRSAVTSSTTSTLLGSSTTNVFIVDADDFFIHKVCTLNSRKFDWNVARVMKIMILH